MTSRLTHAFQSSNDNFLWGGDGGGGSETDDHAAAAPKKQLDVFFTTQDDDATVPAVTAAATTTTATAAKQSNRARSSNGKQSKLLKPSQKKKTMARRVYHDNDGDDDGDNNDNYYDDNDNNETTEKNYYDDDDNNDDDEATEQDDYDGDDNINNDSRRRRHDSYNRHSRPNKRKQYSFPSMSPTNDTAKKHRGGGDGGSSGFNASVTGKTPRSKHARFDDGADGGDGASASTSTSTSKPETTTTMTKQTEGNDNSRKQAAAAVMYDTDQIDSLIQKYAPDAWNIKGISDVGKAHAAFGETQQLQLSNSLDTSNVHSVWSLLTRLDISKCMHEMRVKGEKQCEDVTLLITDILQQFVRLDRYSSTHGGISLNLPRKYVRIGGERCNVPVAIATDETAATETMKEETTVAEDLDTLYGMIGRLDSLIRVLIGSFLVRVGNNCAQYMKNIPFATVNIVYDEAHEEYLLQRLIFENRTVKDDCYRISGFFLVSIVLRTAANLQYPVFVDRSGHLAQIVRKFVREKIFKNRLPEEIKTFLNISMRRKVNDFNILAPLEQSDRDVLVAAAAATAVITSINQHHDPNGVLALVDMAFVKYDSEKKCILVKGYIVATFSSISAKQPYE